MNKNEFVIEETTFVNCPADYEGRVVVPDGITDIGDRAFMFCNKVTEVILPESLQGIGLASFHGCGFSHIKIPSSVTYIADTAFLCCTRLRELDLPEGMSVIANSLCCGCEELKRVSIPDSVVIIREGAFKICI